MTIGAGTALRDIPPGPPPTQSEVPERPTPISAPEPTVAQPSTSPAAAGATWSAGGIAIALVAMIALVAALVALSIYVARRPA